MAVNFQSKNVNSYGAAYDFFNTFHPFFRNRIFGNALSFQGSRISIFSTISVQILISYAVSYPNALKALSHWHNAGLG